ncbi:carbamoyltransferase C-terminal domain-containing protein [Hoeflea sp.]|uniref:carbamoyltransferase C-terminal domain-containing protein n=1 Tax=Hoeflea sp. TaxID=1940281 RepID=UPI0019A98AF6|nr:carbamoyltransferase C-terminal domain-containing protein [Hoeflea sp.]MBC7285466.1 hypothetical protein [Hoeflea sp.]
MKILGLSGALFHDAAACLIDGDRIVAMAEEERFTRRRHAFDALPRNAIAFCLAQAGLKPADLDVIALGWDARLAPHLTAISHYTGRVCALAEVHQAIEAGAELVPVAHHLAHAASAAVSSGWPEAAILVVDGQGETASTAIGAYRNGRITIGRTFGTDLSIGQLYRTITNFVGLPPFAEGKAMGLAAYGDAAAAPQLPVSLTPDGYAFGFDARGGATGPDLDRAILGWLDARGLQPHRIARRYDFVTGPAPENDLPPPAALALAASVQRTTEDLIVHLARLATSQAGTSRLAFAGGVALNCVANGRLIAERVVDDLYVPPVANDAGTALGAAQVVALEAGFRPTLAGYGLGPRLPPQGVRDALGRFGVRFRTLSDPSEWAARAILDGRILGWVEGRAEIGPRALGRRSTIAATQGGRAWSDRINAVKRREAWRPLAPSLAEERADTFLAPGAGSRCMVRSGAVAAAGLDALSACVHVDGSTRAQLVPADDSPYRRLIDAVGRMSGVSAILNTSFNPGGAPIVSTLKDALSAFYTSELDALVIEDMLIEREPG